MERSTIYFQGEPIIVTTRFNERLIEQLLHFSHTDPVMIQHTYDVRRFADRETFDAWCAKDRRLLILTNLQEDTLLGLAWTRRGAIPPASVLFDLPARFNPESWKFTLAKRLYAEARGRGLSKVLLSLALRNLVDWEGPRAAESDGVWLSTGADNHINIRTNSAFGFRPVGVLADNQLLFVSSFRDIRQQLDYHENLGAPYIRLSNFERLLLNSTHGT